MDQARWLRRDAQIYWLQAGYWIAGIGAIPWFLLVGDIWGRHPSPNVKGTLLLYVPLGLVLPLSIGGAAWSIWCDLRSDGWLVGPKEIEVWERGAIAQTIPWAKIRSIDPWTRDQVRFELLEESEPRSLGFQTEEAVLWFREYARGRVAKPPAATTDWY